MPVLSIITLVLDLRHVKIGMNAFSVLSAYTKRPGNLGDTGVSCGAFRRAVMEEARGTVRRAERSTFTKQGAHAETEGSGRTTTT